MFNLQIFLILSGFFRPKDFTDNLLTYSDWNTAKDNRSHNIMLIMKYYFCQKALRISEKSFADNFLYDFNYEKRYVLGIFNSVSNKTIQNYQLVGNCRNSETKDNFEIRFDIYKSIISNEPVRKKNVKSDKAHVL